MNRVPEHGVCRSRYLFVWLVLAALWAGFSPSRPATAHEEEPGPRQFDPRAQPHNLTDTGDPSSSDSPPESATVDPPAASVDASTPPTDPLLFQSGPLRVKVSLDAVVQPAGVTGSWWNLSEQFAPDEAYKPDRAWGEGWVKPGIRADIGATEWLALYSGVSYVGSGNLGKDVFEQGNCGVWAIEDGYLGARLGEQDSESTFEVTYGRQPYKIGSGMLISVGAANGFERGATTTFARRAWEEAGRIEWKYQTLSVAGYYLKPNELPSADTFTRLAGSKLEWNPGVDQTLGVAYFNVFESIYPYVAAPLIIIPDGRQGLNTMHVYGRWNPLKNDLPGWHVAGDYAHQWNGRFQMAADAYNAETGYAFSQLPLMPRVVYAFRLFTGDDPATTRFEKFDPLYYEGAPPLWATGSNGSYSFLNSNVFAHRISLNLTLTPRDFMAFYYWHVMADQINSPIQFGQAGRVTVTGGEPSLVSGVPDPHLSDDFYIEYTRIITPQVFLTSGFAASIPGKGLKELVADSPTWCGGLVNLTVKY